MTKPGHSSHRRISRETQVVTRLRRLLDLYTFWRDLGCSRWHPARAAWEWTHR